MDESDVILKLWYAQGSPEDGNYFVARHSSARQTDAYKDVCDYQLHPILEKDCDLLLFQLVKDLVLHPDFKDFLNAINLDGSSINFNYKNGEREEWFRPYLLFPADDRINTYYQEELKWPYMVGASSMCYHTYGESGIVEEDDHPLFWVYYTVRWDNCLEGSVVKYVEFFRRAKFGMSGMEDNTTQLQSVLCDVLDLMSDDITSLVSWKQRFTSALKMLVTHANELHILHQAGLYDIKALKAILRQEGMEGGQLDILVDKVIQELHRYAMLVVNLIDWQMTGFDISKVTTEIPEKSVIVEWPSHCEDNRHDNVKTHHVENKSSSHSGGFDWDNVWPKYPFERGDMDPEEYEARRRAWLWENNR